MGRRRKRLTITLRGDLLNKVDNLIDGVSIRNRSHAIEFLLDQTLLPAISQAIILTGGAGAKMRPLTYEVPKALIPVKGKPILEYTIELLKKHQIRDLILATGHLGGKIRDYFGDGSRWEVKIRYGRETKPMGTAGALKLARKYLEEAPFLVIHGDVLTKLDIGSLLAFHQNHGGVATMALAVVKDVSGVETVSLDGYKIKKFFRTPGEKKLKTGLVNAGVYVFKPEIFKFIPRFRVKMLEDVFPGLAKKRKLFGYPFSDPWFDVSTPESYEKAIKTWKKK